MRTLSYLSCFLFLAAQTLFGQQKTTVTANSIDISDNLDLRAVATLFGESNDLEDFERRLNDPKIKISNLDLNQDNQVDYLRVVEILENNQHLVVIQAVLGQDLFQDIASLEIEKEARTQRVQVQVVGNEYFYGANYVYEPVFITRPIIFNYFWRPHYVAYYSPWNWGYYPTYYYGWNPYPIYAYRNYVGIYVNVNNYCHYRPNYRSYYYHRSNHYRNNRYNAYERQHPNRGFATRNQGYANRSELNTGRNEISGRNATAGRTQTTNRTEIGTRTNISNNDSRNVSSRNQTSIRTQMTGRNEVGTRSNVINNDGRNVTRNQTSTRAQTSNRNEGGTRSNESLNSNRNSIAVNTNSERFQSSNENRAATRTQLPTVRTNAPSRQNNVRPAISQNSTQARQQAGSTRMRQSTRATSSASSSNRGNATTTSRSNSNNGGRG